MFVSWIGWGKLELSLLEEPRNMFFTPFGQLFPAFPLIFLNIIFLFVRLIYSPLLQHSVNAQRNGDSKINRIDSEFNSDNSILFLPHFSPLVRAQAAVCRGQQRLQVQRKFIQLHGKGGEAIIEEVILWLGICRVTRACG